MGIALVDRGDPSQDCGRSGLWAFGLGGLGAGVEKLLGQDALVALDLPLWRGA